MGTPHRSFQSSALVGGRRVGPDGRIGQGKHATELGCQAVGRIEFAKYVPGTVREVYRAMLLSRAGHSCHLRAPKTPPLSPHLAARQVQ